MDKEVILSKEQLDEAEQTLVQVQNYMMNATYYGHTTKNHYPACSDEVIVAEGVKQMEVIHMGGEMKSRVALR